MSKSRLITVSDFNEFAREHWRGLDPLGPRFDRTKSLAEYGAAMRAHDAKLHQRGLEAPAALAAFLAKREEPRP